MSDRNIEVIKAIKATGTCPETTTVKPTQMITEGLQNVPKTEIRATKIAFNATENKDNN